MKTQALAIRKWKKFSCVRGQGFAYQFPAGHWDCCTAASPVGQSLAAEGMIYPRLDCDAQQLAPFSW